MDEMAGFRKLAACVILCAIEDFHYPRGMFSEMERIKTQKSAEYFLKGGEIRDFWLKVAGLEGIGDALIMLANKEINIDNVKRIKTILQGRP